MIIYRLKDDDIMFNSSYSIEFATNNIKIGTLYSKLEAGVIAAFSANGMIKPLYFQYIDLYGDIHKIKIESILSSKDEQYAGYPIIIYFCNAVIQDKKVKCLLRYRIIEHHWEILY